MEIPAATPVKEEEEDHGDSEHYTTAEDMSRHRSRGSGSNRSIIVGG
jgi:hypothetical protein